MLFAGLSLAMLAGAALAQSADDLVTVLNSTDGASAVAKVVSETPGFLDAIAGKTNLTFVAPNNTAVAQFANSTLGQDASDDYILNLLLYHVINGGYNNITDYYVDHTLLTSSNYTTVTDGAFIGIYYDDDENVIGFYGGDDYNPEGAPTPIPFSQGWIYVVNGVLNIPSTVSETIVYGDFNGSSFDAALEKTGLTEEIDSLHDATYFVPVNDGFAAVNASLAALDTDQLAELLKYHVVAGKVWHFDDFVNGSQLTTLQGQSYHPTRSVVDSLLDPGWRLVRQQCRCQLCRSGYL